MYDWLASHRAPWLSSLLYAITVVFSENVFPYLVGVGCITVMAFTRRWRRPLLYATTLLIGTGLSTGMKYVMARPRPPSSLQYLTPETTPSFPSSHAMISTLSCFLLAYFIVTGWKMTGVPAATAWCAAGFVTLIVCFSRLYLGYHYLTDVIGGIVLGLFVLLCAILADQRMTANATRKRWGQMNP